LGRSQIAFAVPQIAGKAWQLFIANNTLCYLHATLLQALL